MLWGVVAGLLIGAGVGGHALRLATIDDVPSGQCLPLPMDRLKRVPGQKKYEPVGEDPSPPGGKLSIAITIHNPKMRRGRIVIASFAMLLYGTAALLVLCEYRAGLWIALMGPIGGVTAVRALRASLDRFQVVLGVFQFLASFIAGCLLVQ